ncbi:tripartite tricarboxylate transporter TctB family protein [Zavarzinella formosa]|uniref:tripartite tricarboxylate transporter TctB family protein n=1 Tax=Zavarzinella formosa TaxID=360055 RepID=UPI0002E4D673|nr:tripartite tricarboxylate transporter TctB family protein [Zavarzinella formosa]
MQSESFHLLVSMFSVGMGLLFLGIANLILRDRHLGIRFFAQMILVAICTGAILPFQLPPRFPAIVAGILLGVSVLSAVISSSLVTAVLAWMSRSLRKSVILSGMTMAVGLGVVVYGFFKFESDDEAMMNNDISVLEQIVWKPPLHEKSETLAYTDLGHSVLLHEPDSFRPTAEMDLMERQILEQMKYNFALIRHNGPDDGTNCHGWVFAGGRYWLSPDMVGVILADNGYHPVAIPQVGDVVIYQEPQTHGITHSAVVRYVGADSPIVEGKWGWMGVFLHPVDHSCYGANFTYYRSEREGNLLVGLGGKPHRDGMPPVKAPDHPRQAGH